MGGLHSFRHYSCSVSANSGVPELVVMRWLGHRNSDMVKRYYHLHDQDALNGICRSSRYRSIMRQVKCRSTTSQKNEAWTPRLAQ